MTAYVYRLWDADDRLIYVGMTTQQSPQRRIGQHLATRWWASQVVRFDFESHATREAALAAEAKAIRTENPRWNVEGRHDTFDERLKWSLPRWYDTLTNLLNTSTERGQTLSGWFDVLCAEFDKFHQGHNEIIQNPPGSRKREWVWVPGLTAKQLLGLDDELSEGVA